MPDDKPINESDPERTPVERIDGAAGVENEFDGLTLHEVPPELHQRLLGLAEHLPSYDAGSAPDHFDVELAQLLVDSRETRELVGVRDDSAPSGAGWTLLFSSSSADVVIDVTRTSEDRVHVAGELLPRAGKPVSFRVTGESLPGPVDSSDAGRFVLADLAAAQHTMQIQAEAFSLSWTMDLAR